MRALRAAALVVAMLAAGPVQAAVPRLVEAIEAIAAGRNVDVTVQFACTARYVGHSPPESGKAVTLRVRPGADCGRAPGESWPTERPLVTAAGDVLSAAWLEQTLAGEVALTLVFRRPLTFVVAPVTAGNGVRLRLLEAASRPAPSVRVSEPTEPVAGFALNLESLREPPAESEVAAAATATGLPAYVSSIDLEGTTWYRLRVGPIARRADAERLLVAAQARYPRAWLAINDEPTPASADSAPPPPPAAAAGIDPPLADDVRRELLAQARRALAARQYPAAIELATKLTRQAEYPDRAAAQELLGLARERSGQLAHAKAEYAEYLRRYPDGEAAARIRARLRTLAAAARGTRAGSGAGGGEAAGGWQLQGGASQQYRRERSGFSSADTDVDQDSQHALLTDLDLQARRQGERFDSLARLSTGYVKDLMTDGPGDQTRVSSAFFELNDREFGIAARLGRQTRNSGGLLGTFDGLHVAWQARDRLALSLATGFPVESTRESPQSDRRFVGIAAGFGPWAGGWDFGAFAVAQQYGAETDRSAVGFEARYFVPGRTLVALVDYDLAYGELNSAILMGSVQLPARWTAGFNVDHRRSPVLTTRNALIGQPVRTLDELRTLFSSAEIRELADDRTPLTDLYSLSLSRPLGERWQVAVDLYESRTAATPASGGVVATPAAPPDRTLQLQLLGNGIAWADDLFVLAARYQDSDAQTVQSLGLWTRLPLRGAWRIGPRLRVDRRETHADLGSETLYAPSLRLDYQRGPGWFELELGAELGQRSIPVETEKSHRYYANLAYRYAF